MNRKKIKEISFAIANGCGKMTKAAVVTSLITFGIGLIASIVVDVCDRKQMKENLKRK